MTQVFSFKLRGAYNKMASLTAEQRERGVITSSAGNHAQGVSLAASRLVSLAQPVVPEGPHTACWKIAERATATCSAEVARIDLAQLVLVALEVSQLTGRVLTSGDVQGCKATICMPTSTPGIKIDAVRRLGGSVELVGETYSETQTYAQVIC